MAEHPILLVCRAIPEEESALTEELIDRLHLIFSATEIHHSKDMDECFILLKALEELGLIELSKTTDSAKLTIKQSPQTKEIIQYYGN